MDVLIPPPETALPHEPLNPIERVISVFISPVRTFRDIYSRHGRPGFWLPYALSAIFLYVYEAGLLTRLSWDQFCANAVLRFPSKGYVMAQFPASMREQELQGTLTGLAGFLMLPVVIFPAIAILVTVLVRFVMPLGFGTKPRFRHIFAGTFYCLLPAATVYLIRGLALLAHLAPQAVQLHYPNWDPVYFRLDLPATSLGAYLPMQYQRVSPLRDAALLLADTMDVLTLWTLCLLATATSVFTRNQWKASFVTIFALSPILLILAVAQIISGLVAR